MIRRSDAEDARLAAASPARKVRRLVFMVSPREVPGCNRILLQFFVTDFKAQSRAGWRIQAAVFYLEIWRNDVVAEPAETCFHVRREQAVRQSAEVHGLHLTDAQLG